MQNYYETSETYWEMVALYKELFVMFFVSEARDTIYQLGLNGECYMREKGSEWKTCKELSGRLIGVTRTSAEKLEDSWETEDGFTFDEPETGIWTS